jgi:membrane protease YdiL (CAAX protease family)
VVTASWTQDLFLLAPLPLIIVANLGARPVPPGMPQPPGVQAARLLTYLLLGLGFSSLLIYSLLLLPTARDTLARGQLEGLAAGSALALALLWPRLRRLVARLLPLDPESPVHMVALCVTVSLVAFAAGQQLSGDVLAQVASGASLTPADIVPQELLFLVAAVLGVGLFIRRRPAEVAARLGWVRPSWWQVGLGLAAAGLFLAFSQGMDLLAQQITPDLARRSGAATGHLYGGLKNTAGVASIALLPGICEEAFFRGALQPRLGLLWTALVFAAVHAQYGLTLDLVVVLVLGLALGLLRKYANTTTSTIAHVTYNGLAGVLLIEPRLLLVAFEAEGVLLAVLGGLAASRWLYRRRRILIP